MAVAAVLGALTSCSLQAGPLVVDEQKAVAMRTASIVLFRLVATDNGNPVDLDAHVYSPVFRLFLFVENIDTGDRIMGDRARAPTAEARKEGWFYLVLEPGRYYLRVAELHTTSPVLIRDHARFSLSVPAATPVLYAGSLPLTCTESRGIHHFLWCARPLTVTDESGSATQIAQASFAQYGPLATILMKGPQ
jgi:hypothetical protein